jgi:hypothetical protein
MELLVSESVSEEVTVEERPERRERESHAGGG